MAPVNVMKKDVAFLDFDDATFHQFFGKAEPEPVRRSLHELLKDRLAKGMVVERTYVDGDYLACYNVQAARSFTPVERNTTRVHFFDKKVGRRQVESHSPDARTNLQDHYLGFSVIRPDHPATFGRTMIRPPEK